MKCALLLILALSFVAVAMPTSQALAKNVSIVRSFPADFGPSIKDHPDESGAVGPQHVVDFDYLNFVVHDKKTGRVLLKKSQKEFWADVQPAKTFILPVPNDPRVLYDPLSGRWFAVITGDGRGHGYLAVSTASDPTKPWKGVQLPMEPQDLGMKIGVDKNGFYVSYANLTSNIHTFHDCIAIPKADVIAPDGPDLTHLTTFYHLEHESYPATDFDPNKSPTAPEVILNKEFGNHCDKLFMYKITWAGKTASISPIQVIPLSHPCLTPNGQKDMVPQPAPGKPIRADEGRRTNTVYVHGGSVFCCNGAKRTADSRYGVYWCEVRVSDGTVLQEGLVDDPDSGYIHPSLAVDNDGNIALGFTKTSATEYPSVYVTMHAAGDPPGTMRKPVLGRPGTTYYRDTHPQALRSGINWGSYSATCLDPTNPHLLWTCQEYCTSDVDQKWSTAWVAFRLK